MTLQFQTESVKARTPPPHLSVCGWISIKLSLASKHASVRLDKCHLRTGCKGLTGTVLLQGGSQVKAQGNCGRFLAVPVLFALLCSTLEANKNVAFQGNVKQAVVKVSVEAGCAYNVHVPVTCRHARMGFYVFVWVYTEKTGIVGHPAQHEELFEAGAFDVCPAAQRGLCLRASRPIC